MKKIKKEGLFLNLKIPKIISFFLHSLLIYFLLYFLDFIGINNQILKYVLVLALIWPIVILYDFLEYFLRNSYILDLLLGFTKTTPMIFPTIFFSTLFEGLFFDFNKTKLVGLNPEIFAICFFFVILFQDNYYLIFKNFLKNNKEDLSFDSKINNQLVEKIDVREEIKFLLLKRRSSIMLSIFCFAVNILIVFLFFFPIAFISKDPTNNPLINVIGEIMIFFSSVMSIGIIDFFYFNRLLKRKLKRARYE